MLLTIVLAAVLSAEPNRLDTIKLFDAAGDAVRFTNATHLSPLGERGQEVRVWSRGLGVIGWVISDSEIRVYSSDDSNGDLRLVRTLRSKKSASELLLQFSALKDFDGKPIVCSDVRDGSHQVIEGIDSEGSFFSVYAMNARFCNVAGAAQVTKALSHLIKVAPTAP